MDSSMLSSTEITPGITDATAAAGGTTSTGSSSTATTSGGIDTTFTYLTFGGTFRRTFAIFFERFDIYLALSSMVLIPFTILMATITIWLVYDMIEQDKDWEFQPHHLPLLGLVLIIQLLSYVSVTIIGRGAIIHAVAETYIDPSNPHIHWKYCLRQAVQHFKPLVSASLLLSIAFIIGAILPYWSTYITAYHPNIFFILVTTILWIAFIIAVVYCSVSFVMVSPTIIIEHKKSAMDGLKRSWELSNGSRCYIFCTMLCMYFLQNLITRLLHNMFFNNFYDFFFSIVGIILTILPLLAFFPLLVILETVLYLNLRIGRESLNRSILSQDLNSNNSGSGSGMTSTSSTTTSTNTNNNNNNTTSTSTSVGGIGGYSFPSFSLPTTPGTRNRDDTNTDYRQVPLMEDEIQQESSQSPQTQMV